MISLTVALQCRILPPEPQTANTSRFFGLGTDNYLAQIIYIICKTSFCKLVSDNFSYLVSKYSLVPLLAPVNNTAVLMIGGMLRTHENVFKIWAATIHHTSPMHLGQGSISQPL